jgi:tRNA 2-thiocytidine biosynthesis protein TtcA
MPARLVSDNGEHVVVRPLVYVTESEARQYARESSLPIIGCCCPACGDLSLQRQRVKRLIAELEVDHPDVRNSMIRALGNVAGRHLLDKRLHPLPQLAVARNISAPLTLVRGRDAERGTGGTASDDPGGVQRAPSI